MSYEALVEDLVAAQTDVLGDGAVDIAADVSSVEVDQSGAVTGVSGDGVDAVRELVEAYEDRLGGAATVTMQPVADDYADELELPPSLE